ncbi:MAG TPA: hypothetical protein VMR97_07955 [Acidimicrobiales bacterium]|nr:hypothetical protein [Acidimicrobiales bacterium]
MEIRTWKDIDDDTLHRWGNVEVAVLDPVGDVAYRGLAVAWPVDGAGTLRLQRRIVVPLTLDDVTEDRPFLFEYAIFAAGAWNAIQALEFTFDPETLQAQFEAERHSAAAAHLGVHPNRAQRRSPGR